MKPPPDDWKDDRKLWDTLGSLKRLPPPSDFEYQVRQKLDARMASSERSGISRLPSLILLRRWVWGMATAVACLVVAMVVLKSHVLRPASNGETEVASIAEHCDMLQDFEVIENLDELL
jgi:hypothetical protein